MSMTNSIRFSMLNGPNGYGVTKLNGVSLADELDFDEDEDQQTDHDGRESVLSVRRQSNQSRESMMSKTSRETRVLKASCDLVVLHEVRLLVNQAVLDRLEGGILEDDETVPPAKVAYVDTGVQYSPPPSPKLPVVQLFRRLSHLSTNGMPGRWRGMLKWSSLLENGRLRLINGGNAYMRILRW